MGKIRLLIVNADDDSQAQAHITQLTTHLEPEWFAMTILRAADHPSPMAAPGVTWHQMPKGSGWTGARRRRARLRELAQEADVIDVQGWSALAYTAQSGLLRMPVIYTRHRTPPTRSTRQQEQWFMTQVSAVLVTRPELRAGLGMSTTLVDWAGVQADRCRPVRNAEQARRHLGIPEDHLAMAVFGDPTQWAMDILDALFATNENPVLWLLTEAGSARLGAASATMVTVPDTAVEEAMAASDVVLLPAQSSGDPTLLDRAMALGKAIVASRVPGFLGRLQCPIDGILIDPKTPEIWVETVHALKADMELRLDLGRAARQTALVTGPASQARILQGIYAGVLAQRTGRCPTCPKGTETPWISTHAPS